MMVSRSLLWPTHFKRAAMWLLQIVIAVCVVGCQQTGPGSSDSSGNSVFSKRTEVGRNDHYVVVKAAREDTYASLAKHYLNDSGRAWEISDANGNAPLSQGSRVRSDHRVVIPLQPENPVGVYQEGHQVVTVLSYHGIDQRKGKLSVTPAQFDKQLEFLTTNGYRIVPLSDVAAYLRGERALPTRSLAITIDDGYRSAYHDAFPILVKYQVPATLFVYTDFIGRGGLTWSQIKEMDQTGLVAIQPHSKSHADMTLQVFEESRESYLQRLADEVAIPKQTFEKKLDKRRVAHFAYPFGATNKLVVEALEHNDYQLGLTVQRGANAFYQHPYTVRRSMVFASYSMQDFAELIRFFEPVDAYQPTPIPAKESVEQRKARAHAYEEHGDLARALRAWRIIDAIDSSSAVSSTIKRLRHAIEETSQRHLQKAVASHKQGYLAQSEASLLRALAYDPHMKKAHALLRKIEARRVVATLVEEPVVSTSPEEIVDNQQSDANPTASQDDHSHGSNSDIAKDAVLDRTPAPSTVEAPVKTPVSPGLSQPATSNVSAEHFYQTGVKLFNQSLDEAVVAFERALVIDPSHEKARVYLDIGKKLQQKNQ